MPTIHQSINQPRSRKEVHPKSPASQNAPQKKGVCLRAYIRNPKKPNSAKRKATNVPSSPRTQITGYIPGEGHTPQEHSVVLIRGGRVKDPPGAKYRSVGGVSDPKNVKKRKQKRPKHGVKKPQQGTRIHKSTTTQHRSGGRNNQGVITVFHRGGGNSKSHRITDSKRSLPDVPAVVVRLESVSLPNSRIALVRHKNGMLPHTLAPPHSSPGDVICSGPSAELSVGNALPMGSIPVGTITHNTESKPGRGGQSVRAAGTYARMVRRTKGDIVTRPQNSGKSYSPSTQSMATIGMISEHHNVPLRKAGESRRRNRRPVVRGVAMNPIDHPHGGGEGKSKGGRHPVTPRGKSTKGRKRRRLSKAKPRKTF